MLPIQADRVRQSPQATNVTLPAPMRGWNTRDGLAVMETGYAVVLDNWFPESDSLRVRRGYTTHAAGLDGPAQTLYSHEVGSTKKMLAFTALSVFDVSGATFTPPKLKDGFTSGFWSGATIGGNSVFVNGADTPQLFDGAAFSDAAFTGPPNPQTLYGVHAHKNRLFFWEDNSQKFWYGALFSIAGALQDFDLSYVASLTGDIVALETWTYDSGAGVDDALVIFMSGGQVIVYSGNDPGSASDWALQGVYQIGRPLSPRAVQKFGGDIIVATDEGYFPLSKALPLASTSDAISISDTINPSVKDALAQTSASLLWQVILYTRGGMLIVNVPQGLTLEGIQQFDQHVMNTRTGAWARFKDMNSEHWCVFDGRLFFSGRFNDGTAEWDVAEWDQENWEMQGIYEADVGNSDNGLPIETYVLTAYDAFGDPGRLKKWNFARPIFRSETNLNASIAIAVDFEEAPSLSPILSTGVEGDDWDVSDWDISDWASGGVVQKSWQTVSGIGHVGAMAIQTLTEKQSDVRWYSTVFTVEYGGLI